MIDADEVIRILRLVGLRDLMGSDGCYCGWTLVRGVHIVRSCRKSEGTLRVYAQGLIDGVDVGELARVAEEAIAQMRAEDDDAFFVRYCEARYDTGRDGWNREAGQSKYVYRTGKCVYCGEPRARRADYLCAAHRADHSVRLAYRYHCLPTFGTTPPPFWGDASP
jgi:hypothetical protein